MSSPAGWRQVRLGEIGTWFSGGTPDTDNPGYWGGDIPWISAASLKDFRIVDSDRRVTDLGSRNGTRRAAAGSTLFVVRGMSLKTEFRVGIAERDVTFGQDCKCIVPGPDVHPRFLAHALRGRADEILRLVDSAGHGTGRLSTPQLQALKIVIPGLMEQAKIAEVLDTLDDAVRSTGVAIAKLGRVEAGVVRDLLTHGVADSGSVRRGSGDSIDPKGASQLPEGWVVGPVGSFLLGIDAGHSPDVPDRPAPMGAWGVLKVSAVKPHGLVEDENKVVEAPSLIDPRLEVRDGDVLMTRANTTELVGLVCYARRPRPGLMLSDKTLRLKFDPTHVLPEFAVLALQSSAARRQIETCGTGSSGSMKNISQAEIRQIRLAWPSVPEQRRILDALKPVRAQITMCRAQLAKFGHLKVGLADDLLSGRVRAGAARDMVSA